MEMIENLPLPPRGEIGATTGTGYCWGGTLEAIQEILKTKEPIPDEEELIIYIDITAEQDTFLSLIESDTVRQAITDTIPQAMGYIIRGDDVELMDQFGFYLSQEREGFIAFLPLDYPKSLVGEYLSFRYISNTILVL